MVDFRVWLMFGIISSYLYREAGPCTWNSNGTIKYRVWSAKVARHTPAPPMFSKENDLSRSTLGLQGIALEQPTDLSIWILPYPGSAYSETFQPGVKVFAEAERWECDAQSWQC